MSKVNDGGPAFPVASIIEFGMSLRDYFAGQALAAFKIDPTQVCRETASDIAFMMYRIADAAVIERTKDPQSAVEAQQISAGFKA